MRRSWSVCSDFTVVLNDVPQGGVLGSILFLVHISDICDVFSPNENQPLSKLFADDVNFYLDITVQNLVTFQLCRLKFDVNEISSFPYICLKIMYGLVDLTFDDFFTFCNSPHLRGNCLKLELKKNKNKYQSALFW